MILFSFILNFLILSSLVKGEEVDTAPSTSSKPTDDQATDRFKEELEILSKDFKDISPRALAIPISTNLKPIDEGFTKKMLLYAAAVNCQDEPVKKWECTHCKKIANSELVDVYFDKGTECKAFIALDHDTESIVLAFRGTNTILNWLQDAKILLTTLDSSLKGVKVHSGFKGCNDKLLKLYYEPLKRIMSYYNSYKLVVTGHSLGGGIATLATISLRYSLDIDDENLYSLTYGTPRVGNYNFAKFYNSMEHHSIRVTSKNDPIPHLPPKFLAYHHSLAELWIDKKNNSVTCSTTVMEDSKCASSIEPILKPDDHLLYWDVEINNKC